MRGKIVCVSMLLMCATAAADAERFVRKVALPDGRTVVVAEGDFEARSIGSYSVRLYSGDETTFYEAGVVMAREGVVEDIRLADLDGKGRQQLLVIMRSAGTGGYLSAQAFAFPNKEIEARSHVEGLPADGDPVAALTRTTRSDKVLGKGKFHDPNSGAR